MKKILILTMAALLSSCSAGWHIRQAIKKDPLILMPTQLVLKDTIYIPQVSVVDTFLLRDLDTVTIEKDRYWTRIVRVRDSIYVDGGCKSDTVFYTKTIPVPQLIYTQKKGIMESSWIWLVVIAVILLLSYRRF